jgi:NADPH2:quinone reductase
MKATWFNSFGEANRVMEFGEWKKPSPGSNEVLVRLYASGINPSDVKKRAGASPSLLDCGPVIPNSDGAGIIEVVGTDVHDGRIGERVWIFNGQYERQLGTSAEYIVIDQELCTTLPDNTPFEIGACLGIPVMTSHRCVFADGDVKGQIILVTGGAGRVGYYAIQWAKLAGATVIATASSEKSIQECRKAGADLIVGHPNTDVVKNILAFTKGKKIDRIIEGDFGVNLEPLLNVIKTGGVIATYSSMTIKEPKIPFIRMMYLDLTLRMVLVYAMPEIAKSQASSDIVRALEDKKLKHRISKTYLLKDSASAQEYIESGNTYGSVILTM